MQPSTDRIRVAAYLRWERRGYGHGAHVDDWVAAERALTFQDAYDVPVFHRPGADRAPIAPARRGSCRYCELAPPRTRFSGPALAYPACLGNAGLIALDQCDDCRQQFEATIDEALATYLRGWREDPAQAARVCTIPLAAYKGLVRAALALMPGRLIETCPDALEWVNNPDHDAGGMELAPYTPTVHMFDGPAGGPWAALATRRDPDSPLPAILASFGFESMAVELAVPHCLSDDDLDGITAARPEPGRFDEPLFGPLPRVSHRLVVATPARRRGLIPGLDRLGVG